MPIHIPIKLKNDGIFATIHNTLAEYSDNKIRITGCILYNLINLK